jgi:hypothetical protein
MALRIGEKVGITAPNPKRHKLGHGGINPQDEVKQISEGESEDNADHLSTQKILPTVKRQLSSSTTTAKNLDLAAIRAGDMSGSSMFNFQVEEMLLAVRPNYTKLVGPVDKALHRLKVLIESIEDQEPVTVGYLRSRFHVYFHTLMLLIRLPKQSNLCIKLTRSQSPFQTLHQRRT